MLVIALLGFVAFFAFSQGAVIWVLLAEMYPNNIRARGSSIASFSLWSFNTLTAFLFPIVAATFQGSNGIAYAFMFYAIMTITSFFFFKRFSTFMRGWSFLKYDITTSFADLCLTKPISISLIISQRHC